MKEGTKDPDALEDQAPALVLIDCTSVAVSILLVIITRRLLKRTLTPTTVQAKAPRPRPRGRQKVCRRADPGDRSQLRRDETAR